MDRLTAMRTFTRVVETGRFTKVADEQEISQPNVSRQVAWLEREVGARLLHRTTRRIALTEAGQQYYDLCQRVLGELERGEAELQGSSALPRGLLHVSASFPLGRKYLVPIALRFLKAHPGIQFDLELSDRYVDLIREGVDVAIRVGPLKDSSLVARRVGQFRRTLVASPMYLKTHGRPSQPEELDRHNCLLYSVLEDGAKLRFRGPHGEIALNVRGNFRASDAEAIREAALAGLGIAVLPAWLVDEDLRAGRFREVLERFAPPGRSIYAVFPSSRLLAPKVRTFVDFLEKELGKIHALKR